MTDRELLELAAKAALIAYNGEFSTDKHLMLWGYHKWEPLTDDGDALRLAVNLCIQVQPYEEAQAVWAHTQKSLGVASDGYHSYQAGELMREAFCEDRYAATRRAIVRAAAEIGKCMP